MKTKEEIMQRLEIFINAEKSEVDYIRGVYQGYKIALKWVLGMYDE